MSEKWTVVIWAKRPWLGSEMADYINYVAVKIPLDFLTTILKGGETGVCLARGVFADHDSRVGFRNLERAKKCAALLQGDLKELGIFEGEVPEIFGWMPYQQPQIVVHLDQDGKWTG